MMFTPCPVCQVFTPVEDDSLLTDEDQIFIDKLLIVESIDDLLDANALTFFETDYALALIELLRPQIVEDDDGDELVGESVN